MEPFAAMTMMNELWTRFKSASHVRIFDQEWKIEDFRARYGTGYALHVSRNGEHRMYSIVIDNAEFYHTNFITI